MCFCRPISCKSEPEPQLQVQNTAGRMPHAKETALRAQKVSSGDFVTTPCKLQTIVLGSGFLADETTQ
jgi:hypothetical protein